MEENFSANCKLCNAIFHKKRRMFCSKECLKKHQNISRKSDAYKESSRKGGLVSATKQCKRSINEIYFSILCKIVFENVLTNEPIFEGWDADIIIPDYKIAISWNGAWHYQKIREEHNLKQVQSRDKIKDEIIKKHGYEHYIIKDLGTKCKKFVKLEFEKFLNYLNNNNVFIDNDKKEKVKNFYISLEDLSELQIPFNKNIKKNFNKKCLDCDQFVKDKKAIRCLTCYKLFLSNKRNLRPTLETLLKDKKELGCYETGRKYNVSDKTIRKWIRIYQKELDLN